MDDFSFMGWMCGWVFVGGLVGAAIGSAKGNGGTGFALGALLGPIGWIIAALQDYPGKCPACGCGVPQGVTVCKGCGRELQGQRKQEPSISGPSSDSDREKCPFCAELILREAIKCRFCGSDMRTVTSWTGNSAAGRSPAPLVESGSVPRQADPQSPPVQAQQLKGSRKSKVIALCALGIVLVLCVWWFGLCDVSTSQRKASMQADTNQASLPAPVVEKQADNRPSAETRDAQAQVEIGERYYQGQGGVGQNWVEAVKWFRKAAEQNNATAQCNLGVCYAIGQGVTEDHAEALNWYRRAAEQNDTRAQLYLGVCYADGQGVAKDEAEAVKWYRKAAEQNNAGAQKNLGVCYANGQGVAKDEMEAVKWYRKAAEQKHERAQYAMGNCYYLGRGVERNYAEAVEWYRAAAAEGDMDAGFALGICYYYGNGVTQDAGQAFTWYRWAAERGHKKAQEFIDAADARAGEPSQH
jgi:TPR repeat protein